VKNKEIEIEGMEIEEVNSAKYFGTIMNADNLIEEEIKERIGQWNLLCKQKDIPRQTNN